MPAPCNALAIAAPIRCAPPVINATLPVSCSSCTAMVASYVELSRRFHPSAREIGPKRCGRRALGNGPILVEY
jgi:hypothetical protein